jgi:hypothetical protein
MISRVDNLSSLRFAIIADTKIFLRGLDSGASDEQLRTIAQRIRDKEQQLLRREGVVLDPNMWRILHSRLINRKVEFADPDS